MAGVVQIDVLRVRVHRADLLPDGIGIVRQIDAVAQRLGHLLLAVRTWQTTRCGILGQHDVRLYQDGRINLIEAANEFASHLQHRLLVFTGRNGSSLEQRDVGSLRDRIAEEAQWNALPLEATHLDLSLHRRVALYARNGDEVHQISGQLGQFRNLALNEERTLLRIQSCREVVECHVDNALADLLRIVGIIRQSLYVGHKHKHLVVVASILQLHTATQRTHIVSQVELARRTVACQYDFSHILA